MSHKLSRRSFARDLAVAATAAAVLPPALAQTTPQPSAAPPPKPPDLSPASQAEVEARIQWIVTKYGSRLNDEQRADIRRLITSGQGGVEAMRAYPLDNSAEPSTPFRVYRRSR